MFSQRQKFTIQGRSLKIKIKFKTIYLVYLGPTVQREHLCCMYTLVKNTKFPKEPF